MRFRFVFLFSLAAFYFIIGASYTFFLGEYDFKRIFQGVILVVSLAVVFSSKIIQEKLAAILAFIMQANRWLGWAIILLLILSITSSVLAAHSGFAFLELSHHLLLFNLMIIGTVAYLKYPSKFEILFLSLIGFMAGLYLINVLISHSYSFIFSDYPIWPNGNYFGSEMENGDFFYVEPFLNFAHFRILNHVHTWTLPLLTLLVIRIPERCWAIQKIAFIVACGWWMLVFASDARGTMVASFIAIGFIFLTYKSKAKEWLKIHGITAGIGMISYYLLFKILPLSKVGGRTAFSRYSDSGRFEIWDYAWQLALENPFLGVGPMHFAQLNSVVKNPNASNMYLQYITEFGFIAGFILIFILAYYTFKWLRYSHKAVSLAPENSFKTNTLVALTASFLAAFIHAFVTKNFTTPMSQTIMALVLAWMIGLQLSESSFKKYKTKLGRYRMSYLLIILMTAIFMAWSYVLQVPKLDENREKYKRAAAKIEFVKGSGFVLHARYWTQGVIGIKNIESLESEE